MEPGPPQTDLMGMGKSLRISAIVPALCALGLAQLGRAEGTPPPAEDTTTPVLKATAVPTETAPTPAPKAPAPKHERQMSNAVASFLSDGAPKYNPPPKEPEKSEEDQPDLRETDKPKNRIVRLPKYVVKEPPPPVFSDHELRSREERTRLAMTQNFGLHMGNMGGLNEPIALFMYEEQQRLRDQAQLKDQAKNASNSGDTSAADYISKQTNRATYRPSDFGWNSDAGWKSADPTK